MPTARRSPRAPTSSPLIPGGDRADEYVILGAHYDHLGTRTAGSDDARRRRLQRRRATTPPAWPRCSRWAGSLAADDRAAVALGDPRLLGCGGGRPRSAPRPTWPTRRCRSSRPSPTSTGTSRASNLSPSRRRRHRDGRRRDRRARAGGRGRRPPPRRRRLQTLALQPALRPGRAATTPPSRPAGVPTVFFTDANTGCYHTAQDDIRRRRLRQAGPADPHGGGPHPGPRRPPTPSPSFVAGTPPATYEDAESMLEVVQPGPGGLRPVARATRPTGEQFLADLEAMVDAGPDAFDDARRGHPARRLGRPRGGARQRRVRRRSWADAGLSGSRGSWSARRAGAPRGGRRSRW